LTFQDKKEKNIKTHEGSLLWARFFPSEGKIHLSRVTS